MSGQDSAVEADVIRIPEGVSLVEFVRKAKNTISNVAVKYKRENGNPPPSTELEVNTAFLRAFLPWLQTEVHMTPTLRDRTQIHRALEVLADPKYKVPSEFSEPALAIYNQFQADDWGTTSTIDSDGEGADAEPTPSTTSNNGLAGHSTHDLLNAVVTIRLPPPNHPIWGLRGIMHGAALTERNPSKPRSRSSYVLDSRYLAEKRDPKIFGHNGLVPGAWWPFQIVALFNGAHGAMVKGIAGDAQQGTWSVVLSGGTYDDLDSDGGDVIWYSGDGAHDNEDPNRIVHATNTTRSLHTSRLTRKPVRVLRSSKGKTAFAPTVGFRYDGLYAVVAMRHQKNKKGGLFEQFKLERLPGQPSLDDIRMSVPTAKQMQDFNRINERY